MSRALLTAVLAAIVIHGGAACTLAQAATFDRVSAAKRVAERVWDSPCDGTVKVRVAPLEQGLIGLSTFTRPAVGEYRDCLVTLSLDEFGPGQSSYAYWCTAVLHHYGLLAGSPFSRSERSVMYPVIGVDARCTTKRS